MERLTLPYFDEREASIDTIVIHCLAYDVEDALKSFVQNEVSAHFLIDEKGKIYNLVDEQKRAWHAGISFWKGKTNLNHNSVGIELCSPMLGQSPYPMRQISALIRLCQHLKRKYHIKKERIIGHSDIAPTRKPDPGKAFPWHFLARRGLGIWYNKKNAKKIAVEDEKALLEKIGYDVTNQNAARWAFIRHFMPAFIPTDTVENLLKKPYPDEIKIDMPLLIQTLKAVLFEIEK